MTLEIQAQVILQLETGTTNGYSLTINDNFYSGSNKNGTTSPTGDAAEFPVTATKDNILCHTGTFSNEPSNPTGAFTISGLDPTKFYTLTFFGSRTGVSPVDNRETLYTVSGATANIAVALDCTNNTSNVITAYNAQPTSAGDLSIKVEAGPNNTNTSKFCYLGAMKMRITSASITTSLNDIPQNLSAFYHNGVISLGDFTGEVNVFTTTGKLAAKGTAVLGYFKVDIENGIYIVKAGNSTSKLIVK